MRVPCASAPRLLVLINLITADLKKAIIIRKCKATEIIIESLERHEIQTSLQMVSQRVYAHASVSDI
jgi:hypothetical protein